MTASTIDRPGADTPDGEHTPAQVRAALAEISDASSMRVWDDFLDRVYLKARASGSLEQLQKFLEDSWGSVLAYREFELNGPPPRERRLSREQFIAGWEARNGRPFPTAA